MVVTTLFKDAACRFVSVRAGCVFEVLRFVPVRVKIRLRVTRFVSRVSENLSACHACRDPCALLCVCVSLRVMRVACHACRMSRVS